MTVADSLGLRIGVHVPYTISTTPWPDPRDDKLDILVPARRDVVLLADCSRAQHTDGPRGYSDGRDASPLPTQAGAAARPSVGAPFLATSCLRAWGRTQSPLPYASTITATDASDLNTERSRRRCGAQMNLGDVAAADRNAGQRWPRLKHRCGTS